MKRAKLMKKTLHYILEKLEQKYGQIEKPVRSVAPATRQTAPCSARMPPRSRLAGASLLPDTRSDEREADGHMACRRHADDAAGGLGRVDRL